MIEQVSFTLRGRNPDVLACIANLSNDEVFTPPEFANKNRKGVGSLFLTRSRRFR
jgi:site-specific DNA-methyltransferase (adenine-specific)